MVLELKGRGSFLFDITDIFSSAIFFTSWTCSSISLYNDATMDSTSPSSSSSSSSSSILSVLIMNSSETLSPLLSSSS